MIFRDLFNRHSRRNLLIEINPYRTLVAGLTRPDEGAIRLDCAAEFETGDEAGLRAWLDTNFERQKAWVPVICGFVPPEALLQRESIQPRRLVEPGYFGTIAKEQYQIERPDAWTFHAVTPLEGLPLPAGSSQRPALLSGVSNSDVHQLQQRLLDHRLLPFRVELGLLPLLGVIADYKARRNEKSAVVVIVIEQEQTVAYIIGKEGVATPAPVRHGFASIVQLARKEFDLTDAAAVRERFLRVDDELQLRAGRLVRAIGRDLKPVVDSFEMATGQSVGEIYCAYLPPELGWIARALADVVGRAPFALDCAEWLPTVNLQGAEGVTSFAPHWLGALSLVADVPGQKLEKTPREDAPHQGPWRVDYRLSAALPSNDLVRRRFIINVVAVTLAVTVFMITAWQLYASRELSAQIEYWEKRNTENRRPVAEVNQLSRNLSNKSERIKYAYELMQMPYPVSDFILSLGRSHPTNIRIDAISSSDTGVVVRGGLRQSSEEASRSAKRYVEDLRRDPAIGPLFGSITLTSFNREGTTDVHIFEITFRLKDPKGLQK
ncbi:MAG: hypothetical protein H7343_20195 [Undibacterium sp.]|nr:hypothetical protein [Opitutaceae bacterium]